MRLRLDRPPAPNKTRGSLSWVYSQLDGRIDLQRMTPNAPDELLRGLFSPLVASVETRATEPDESLLWPEEWAAIEHAVAGRRRDYILGRRCARLAMTELGVDPVPPLPGDKRQPLWPPEVVGAITHTEGYAAAAVARADNRSGVGIDVEPNAPLPGNVITRIARPEEVERIETQANIPGIPSLDRLLFCAKEATYKVWYPLAECWLGYLDASVTADPEENTFEVEILVDGPTTKLTGRYAADEDYIVTAIELSRQSN